MHICGNLSIAVLLFCYKCSSEDTNAARKTQMQLQKTQTQPRKICKRSFTVFWKPMCVRTQHSSEEAFRFFGRKLQFSEEAFQFAEEAFQFAAWAALQTHFGKAFQMSASFFLDVYRSLGNCGQWEDTTPSSSEFLCKIYESVSALWQS